jgi:hypothetical protein
MLRTWLLSAGVCAGSALAVGLAVGGPDWQRGVLLVGAGALVGSWPGLRAVVRSRD